MANDVTLVVCDTCRRPGAEISATPEAPRDGARLAAALEAAGLPVRRQSCLSACSRGCVAAFAGPGRWTYVQGALDPDLHLEDLLAMARAYAASADGIVPWRERPEVIRKNTVARIPPLEI